MTPELLSLVMDFVVLLALAGTIYYVMRLSKALNNFKAHRDEMKNLVIELSGNIDQAQQAVTNLKASSNAAADDLDDLLHDSRKMAEELKMINETGDALANRLEKLAHQSRNVAAKQEESYFSGTDDGTIGVMPDKIEEERASFNDEMPSFFIKDMDFEKGQNDPVSHDAEDDGAEFVSQAERELYDALKKNKTTSGR